MKTHAHLTARLSDSALALSVCPIDGRPVEAELPLGRAVLLREAIRHDPPTEGDMEWAIEIIEDAIMASAIPRQEQAVLHLDDGWPAALRVPEPGLHRDAVEGIYRDLSAVAAGRPASLITWPTEPGFVACALMLRELMHHLGIERALVE